MPCEGPLCVGRSSIYDVTGLGNGSHWRQLTFEYLDTSTGELEGAGWSRLAGSLSILLTLYRSKIRSCAA
jgi:hypothetical protein